MVSTHLVLVAFLLAGDVHLGAAETTDAGDAAAMRTLAKGLGADRALGWTGSANPYNWTGVTCTDGRVTAIQVGNRSLAGTLPPEVRNLTSLLRLEVHNNRLSGPLPSLAGLSFLQALLLHGNRFSGSPPPDFFSGLSSLQSVFLDDNPFDPWPIPANLKDAAALVNFSANSANVSSELPDFLATAFPSLDHLALAFNFLSGPVPASFATAPLRSLLLQIFAPILFAEISLLLAMDAALIPSSVVLFINSSPASATVPAFPEQSVAAVTCHIDLPPALVHSISAACSATETPSLPSRPRCCPALAAWLFSAHSTAGLATRPPPGELVWLGVVPLVPPANPHPSLHASPTYNDRSFSS